MIYLYYVVRWIWEFPQMLIGFILSRFCRKVFEYGIASVYSARWLPAGVSLGLFLFAKNANNRVMAHEYGHSMQSLKLGPLYLLVVGVPSVVRNIYDRVAHRKWDSLKRNKWYYGGFPEKWADELIGIKRFEDEEDRNEI